MNLFVSCFFLSELDIFSLIWRRHIIIAEGLQILTKYTRHSWPLSSEGFFSVPHLLRPETLKPVAESLEVELFLSVLTI